MKKILFVFLMLQYFSSAFAQDIQTSTVVRERASLKTELELMGENDQKHRTKIFKAADDKARAKLWEEQLPIDKVNQDRIDEIVKAHGWPGQKEFGAKASQAAFLVIQHAPVEMMKRYQPMLRVAMEKDDLRKESYAMFEDRVLMYEGRGQTYGSQLHTDNQTGKRAFWKIEDEVNVDKRRAQMGMGPLVEYAKFFGIEYMPLKVVPDSTEKK